jgi:cell wall-associated NlpC family hydrolase
MTGENLKRKLIYFSEKHLGKPYKYGSSHYEAPRFFDCSSFVQYLYKRIGIKLPRSALLQAHCGRKVNFKKEKLKTGDLIFIKGKWGHYNPEFPSGIGHVAMYIEEGKIVHAEQRKDKKEVLMEKSDKILKRNDLVVVKRII